MMLDQGLKADGFVGVPRLPGRGEVLHPRPTLDAPTSALDPVSPQARAESAGALASQLDATTRAVAPRNRGGVRGDPGGPRLPAREHLPAGGLRRPRRHLAGHRCRLLADATASWFWRGLRWAITAAVLKPALALVLIIGVNMLSRPSGLSGLLAAAGVLLVALFCPFALYRLLAFVDPGTNAGMTARGLLNISGLSGGSSGGGAGGGSGSDGSGGGDGGEAAHAARFDAAGGGSSGAADMRAARARAAAGPGELGPALVAGCSQRGCCAPLASSPVWVPAVAAAGQFASQYANQTMDASGSVTRTAAAAAPPPPPAAAVTRAVGLRPAGVATADRTTVPMRPRLWPPRPNTGTTTFLRIRASTPTTTTLALATDRVTASTP